MADAEQAVLTSSAKNFDVSGERGSESICLCSEIKGSLKIQPEPRAHGAMLRTYTAPLSVAALLL